MPNQVAPSPWLEILKMLKAEILSDLRVSLPGTIAGVDPSTGTVSVDIGVMQNIPQTGFPQGRDFPYPRLTGCPVFTYQGGGAGVVMPVKIGDECDVLFSDRALNNWFTTGVANPLPSKRMHNLSDGIVLVGLNSLQKKLVTSLLAGEGGLCETNASAPGIGAAVALNPTTHKISIRNQAANLATILTGLTSGLSTFVAPTGPNSLITVLLNLVTVMTNLNIALIAGTVAGQHFDAPTLAALAAITTQLSSITTQLGTVSATATTSVGAAGTAVPTLLN